MAQETRRKPDAWRFVSLIFAVALVLSLYFVVSESSTVASLRSENASLSETLKETTNFYNGFIQQVAPVSSNPFSAQVGGVVSFCASHDQGCSGSSFSIQVQNGCNKFVDCTYQIGGPPVTITFVDLSDPNIVPGSYAFDTVAIMGPGDVQTFHGNWAPNSGVRPGDLLAATISMPGAKVTATTTAQ